MFLRKMLLPERIEERRQFDVGRCKRQYPQIEGIGQIGFQSLKARASLALVWCPMAFQNAWK